MNRHRPLRIAITVLAGCASTILVLPTRGADGVAPLPLDASSRTTAVIRTAAASGAASGPAGSQTAGAATLTLQSQSNWVTDGGTFSLQFTVPPGTPVGATDATITVFEKLSSRSGFDQALRVGPSYEIKNFGTLPLSGLTSTSTPGSGTPTFGFSFQVTSGDTPAAANAAVPTLDLTSCPSSGCSGVYPVTIAVTRPAGGTIAPLQTDLVYVESTRSLVPLGFSWVVPFAPGSSADQADRLAATLNRTPQVPFTLLAVPQEISRLAGSGRPEDTQAVTSLGALFGSTGDHILLPALFADANVSSLVDSGLSGELDHQLDTGDATLTSLLHAAPETNLWAVYGPIDRAGLAALQARGAGELVLPENDLQPVASSLTVTHPWLISPTDRASMALPRVTGTGHDLEAATSDTGFDLDVSSTTDPVLAAHRVLADLAQVWSDAPNQTNPPRALVYMPSPGVPLDPNFANALLGGLTGNPIVTPMSLASYFAQIPPGYGSQTPVSRLLIQDPRIPGLPAGAIRSARASIDAISSAMGAGSEHATTIGDLLLASEGAGLSAAQRDRDLRQVNASIASIARGVSLSGSRTITLTSATGTIPITVASTIPFLTKASVTVTSDKLAFPHTADRSCRSVARGITCPITLTNTTNTINLRVIARASGAFPLKVSVGPPSGSLVFTSASFTVRSTAFSGVAIGITGAALLFLIAWWGRSIVRSRRAIREVD